MSYTSLSYTSEQVEAILKRHKEVAELDWRFAVIAALLTGLIFGWLGHSVFNLVAWML